MEKVIVYEYDKRNFKEIENLVEEQDSVIVDWVIFNKKSDENKVSFPGGTEAIYIDISSLLYNEDRAENIIGAIVPFLNITVENYECDIFIIVDKRYSEIIKNTLYLRISEIQKLEKLLGMPHESISNVIDIDEAMFNSMIHHVNDNLFGNDNFKKRLKEELVKYRLFNKIGEQPVFSVFVCGESGIGKTEVARLLHNYLSPTEKMIKINFGNYSDENALSSLIGSPRGYIGSNKGELSEKILKSKSKIILIDEFEKASKPVFNFFLELLEDGAFTDSLGREFDLNKYLIIFTSNIKKQDVSKTISPELMSRFNFMCQLNPLSQEDKQNYINYKTSHMVKKIEDKLNIKLTETQIIHIKDIDTRTMHNLRDINTQIMNNISKQIGFR
ncbi:AAA family ATPase [Clostridium sp. 19966]|uniref:Chaperone protein ClpB n=1 Tax=Clostridium butyricum TaxID=1492 RepID=A0A6N2ZUI9_CLOBU|nr:AAA family ATPase [Clostridium sp. 19966]MDT8717027.1 AAA family ATPase [Clostridium sp. 19966]